ncbi:MAG: hypothetical protein RIS94_578 [Pseudomonadota bacterium]
MNRESTGHDWRDSFAARCEASPSELHDLAAACENTAPRDQRRAFERVLALLNTGGFAPVRDEPHAEASLPVALLADSGAFESAALALLPTRASFTGGRLADGTFVAQVILPSGAGAHSRAGRSLAMAWLAALLRALAREIVEQRSVR